jgi:hypothetical protein
MFAILILFLIWVASLVVLVPLVDKHQMANDINSYIESKNPQTHSDVDRLLKEYYKTSGKWY